MNRTRQFLTASAATLLLATAGYTAYGVLGPTAAGYTFDVVPGC